MGYLTDEQAANEALTWWGRYPDSIEALVSLSDDAASDEHGNVIGHVEWQHHPDLKIMLAGSNGLVYSTRHAKKASGWHRFFVIGEEKETQRIFKRRLQASNKAYKMNTQSNDTGNTDMDISQAQLDNFKAQWYAIQCMPIMEFKTISGDYLVVDIALDMERCGLTFELSGDYDLEDDTRFSGDIVEDGGGVFFIPFNEYEDNLDHYLNEVHMEVLEGYLIPCDKLK